MGLLFAEVNEPLVDSFGRTGDPLADPGDRALDSVTALCLAADALVVGFCNFGLTGVFGVVGDLTEGEGRACLVGGGLTGRASFVVFSFTDGGG